jgi:hypothetical protein
MDSNGKSLDAADCRIVERRVAEQYRYAFQ